MTIAQEYFGNATLEGEGGHEEVECCLARPVVLGVQDGPANHAMLGICTVSWLRTPQLKRSRWSSDGVVAKGWP